MSDNTPNSNAGPNLGQLRAQSAVFIRNILLLPLILVILVFIALTLMMIFSDRSTLETLARSAPILIVAGMTIGLFGFMAGLLLLWFDIQAETVLNFEFWIMKFSATTKGAGLVAMLLGAALAILSLWVITQVVYEERSAGQPMPTVVDETKATQTTEEPHLRSQDPDAVLDLKPSK